MWVKETLDKNTPKEDKGNRSKSESSDVIKVETTNKKGSNMKNSNELRGKVNAQRLECPKKIDKRIRKYSH